MHGHGSQRRAPEPMIVSLRMNQSNWTLLLGTKAGNQAERDGIPVAPMRLSKRAYLVHHVLMCNLLISLVLILPHYLSIPLPWKIAEEMAGLQNPRMKQADRLLAIVM